MTTIEKVVKASDLSPKDKNLWIKKFIPAMTDGELVSLTRQMYLNKHILYEINNTILSFSELIQKKNLEGFKMQMQKLFHDVDAAIKQRARIKNNRHQK